MSDKVINENRLVEIKSRLKQLDKVKTDCIFLKDDWKENICNGCKALRDMYCKAEECRFYKTKNASK